MRALDNFSKAGEAMLLAHDGNLQLAQALVAAVRNAFVGLKSWLASMPTSLPPTESHR